MKAVNFKEANVTFSKDQPQHLQLPAYRDDSTEEKIVVSCYKMSFKERIIFLFTNRIWLSVMTFGNPLHPQRLNVNKKEVFL